ncbi:hypothetical protein D3C86_2010410 [compost metagenome]
MNGRAQVASTDVYVHPAGEPGVFAAQHRRSLHHLDARHVRQHNLLAPVGHDGKSAQLLHRVAVVAWVTDTDGKARQPVHYFPYVIATDGR